ncbi:hypothetical protein FRB98_008204 [Tulasnella sp. 332]|nr:hypothetical protein FRB98_008204 [Tulasnella sp. 332]
MRVIYFPCLVLSCSTIGCLGIIVYDAIGARTNPAYYVQLFDLTIIVFSLNIVTTWYLTGALVYRLWYATRETRYIDEFEVRSERAPYGKVIRVIIESGIVYSFTEGAILACVATKTLSGRYVLEYLNIRIIGIVAALLILQMKTTAQSSGTPRINQGRSGETDISTGFGFGSPQSNLSSLRFDSILTTWVIKDDRDAVAEDSGKCASSRGSVEDSRAGRNDSLRLATAIPKISSDFDALEQQTWIASAYFLTQSGFILTYGQLLAVANTKWIYLIAVSIFEIGSIICGAAPGMNVLIFGRALAGVGAAGIFVTTLCILARITRIQQRALLFGLFGAVFALSSVIGPLLGGVFTDHVSWRWCFFINIPFGIITIVTILLFIKREHSAPPANPSVPEWKRIMQIDWIGCLLSIGIITALLLPLQWGGVTKSWSDNMGVAYGREGRHATVNVEELDSNRVLRVRVLQHAYPLDLYLLSSSVLPKLRGEIRNIERNRNHHVHGGAIGIAIAGTIFGNQLTSSMAKYAPNLSSSIVLAVRQSVNVIYTLPVEDKANVIRAYSESLGAQAQA